MTSQCTYTFDRRNFGKHKYDKIFKYINTHRDFSLSRLKLLYKSGYISTGRYRFYSQDSSGNGYLCYITGKMRELGILSYSTKTQKWSIGPNFDYYYNLNK